MVVAGGFSARLIDAATKEPFKEHTGPKGEIYVEMEPDAEYLIEIQVVGDGDSDKDNGQARKRFLFKFFVDGKDVGFYSVRSQLQELHHVSLWSRQNGKVTTRAFRLERPQHQQPRRGEGANQPHRDHVLAVDQNLAPPDMLMGSVTIKVCEAIFKGREEQKDFLVGNKFQKSQNHAPVCRTSTGLTNFSYDIQEKKVLRTVEGSVLSVVGGTSSDSSSLLRSASPATIIDEDTNTSGSYSSAKPKTAMTYKAGVLLQEINLNYCTALGLIHAGVLPKPPLWEHHRLHFGRNKPAAEESETPLVPFKKVKIAAVYDGGIMVSAPKEVEVFDLVADLVEEAAANDKQCDDEDDGEEDPRVVSQDI